MGGGDDICEEHCNNNNIYTLTSSTSTPPMFHHGVAASTFPITDDNDNNNFNAGTTSLDPTPSTIPAATTTSPPPPPPLLQTAIAWYCLQASYILTAHIRRAILSCSYAGNSLRRAHETRSWKIAFLEECVEFMLAVLQLKEDCHALGYHPGGEILGSTLRHLDFLFRQCYLTIRFEQQLQLEINRIAALLRNRIGGSSETISIASEQNRSTEELFEVGTAMLASIRECCLTGTAASGYTCKDVLTELESLLRELAWDDLYYQWVSYQNRIQNNPAGNKNGPAGALQNEIDLMMRRKGVTKPDSNYNNVSTKSNSTPGSPSSLLDAVRMVIGSDSSLVSQVLANATRSMSDLRKVISQINTGKLLPLLERISRLQQLLNQAVAQQKNASSSSSSSASRNNNNNNNINDLQMSIAAYRNRLNDTKKEFDTTLEYKKILKTAFESTKRIVVSLSGFVMDAQSLAAILEWCELQHQFLTRIYLPPTTTNNGDSIRIYLTDWAHHLESIRNELHRHCTILVQQLLQQQRNTTTAAGGKMSINCSSLLDSPSPFVVTTTNSTTTTATTDEDVISQASSELHSLLHERMLKNGSAMPRHLLDLYLKSSYSPLFSVLYSSSSSSSSSSYVDSLSTVGGERHVLLEFNECFFKAGSLVPQKTKAKFVHWVTHTYNRGISSSTIGGGGAGGGGDDSTTSEERLRRRIAALHAALHQAAAAAGAYDNN